MPNRDYLSNVELLVMTALLRRGNDAYGVEIAREIKQVTGREIAFGSLYATLDRLESKGAVSSMLGEPTPERGGRAKRYFSVTTTGVRDVRATQRALVRLWQGLPQLEDRRA